MTDRASAGDPPQPPPRVTTAPYGGRGRRSRRRGGFTLVELLIALAMVGLITLLLFTALRIGSRTWDSVDLVAERAGALRLARDFLQQALSQTRETNLVFDGSPVSVFAGDGERLELVTPLAERVGVPGLYILRLTLEEAGDGRDLVLTRWLIHPELLAGGEGIPAWEPPGEKGGVDVSSLPADLDAAGGAFGRTRLLEGVDAFEIQYFGAASGVGGESEPEWREDWLDQGVLPALVRIRLTAQGQSWPDLIVALPAQYP